MLKLKHPNKHLEQGSILPSSDGRVIATLEDYARVRVLVADLVSEGVEATVPATDRETVETVERLRDETEAQAREDGATIYP